MSQQTPPSGGPESAVAPATENPSKKRPLETAAAEFLEQGWKLLGSVETKKEHPPGNVKVMGVGEPAGLYLILKKKERNVKKLMPGKKKISHIIKNNRDILSLAIVLLINIIYIEAGIFKMLNGKIWDILIPVVNQNLANSMTLFHIS
jgi:hypothetical protein